jgi:hypothetical protein
LAPRDAKQYANSVGNERKKHDDVIGLYLTHNEIPEYIHVMQLIPEFVIVFFTMPMMTLFDEVVHMPELVLHYDTTFNIGDFSMSLLVYKQPAFEKGPVILLAYMLHQSKKTDVHKLFFETFKTKCKAIEVCVFKFIIDREADITKVLQSSLPNVNLYYCWNKGSRK